MSTPAMSNLPATEQRHPRSHGLDGMSSLEILTLLNEQDASVAAAVRPALEQLAGLVDRGVEALESGGSVHYFGAGTSGRLAVLDAAELMPTFALEPGRVVAHLAGGAPALLTSIEGAEDSVTDGAAAAASLTARDVAIGLTASGTTPYVHGALEAAHRAGATTALVTSNAPAHTDDSIDIVIVVETGPEVLTGSTRLKAGTAAKFVLNGFSTALMVRGGRAWSNLMVSLVATNEKLRHRSARILTEATGLGESDAVELLQRTNGDLKTAIVSTLGGVDVDVARSSLDAHGGIVRAALVALTP